MTDFNFSLCQRTLVFVLEKIYIDIYIVLRYRWVLVYACRGRTKTEVFEYDEIIY